MRNVLKLPPVCNVSKNGTCTVRSLLMVVSPSRESSSYTTGLRAMTTSGGTPGGGTPSATRSFTCWPTLASEWVMPSRPTPVTRRCIAS